MSSRDHLAPFGLVPTLNVIGLAATELVLAFVGQVRAIAGQVLAATLLVVATTHFMHVFVICMLVAIPPVQIAPPHVLVNRLSCGLTRYCLLYPHL